MLKKIIFFFILIFNGYAYASQCEYIAPEKILSIESYVFTGKVLSKQSKTATVSIVKSYKGNLPSKIQISYVPEISGTNEGTLNALEIGETYLFSSSQPFKKEDKLIQIVMCSWTAVVKSLDKKTIEALKAWKKKHP